MRRLVHSGTVLIFASQLLAAKGAWVTDIAGCKIWDPLPVRNESVAWSGECLDGYADGPGVVQWTVHGRPGPRFEGTLTVGKLNGTGVATFPEGGYRYDGAFQEFERTGHGIMTGPGGERYEGDWVDNKRSGTGSMVFEDGDRYEGQWKNNVPSGQGIETWVDGRHYEGEFIDGAPVYPKRIKGSGYAFNAQGHGFLRPNFLNLPLPPDKSYDQLTAEEKLRVKELYATGAIGEGDEPPYPVRGLGNLIRAIAKVQGSFQARGLMSMAVIVDSTGKPIKVEAYEMPNKQLAQAVANVLLSQQYKPALCNGTPCAMPFPLKFNFRPGM
jgi:hypothetical protein